MFNLLINSILLFVGISYVQCQNRFDQHHEIDNNYEWCIDSNYHKHKPGREDKLHQQCTPWKDYSCCTLNTTESAHAIINHYKFDFNHCSKMSSECLGHFIQDLCFYECEPYVKPWVINVTRSFARQRIYNVPLCAAQCNSWWEACKEEMTCAKNWAKDFQWVNKVNQCKPGAECRRFKEVYESAEEFCEQVWDHSWKYTEDEKCMKIWFSPTISGHNPNKEVAQWYANHKELINNNTGNNKGNGGIDNIINLMFILIVIPIITYFI